MAVNLRHIEDDFQKPITANLNMSVWSETDRRLGFWSAAAVVLTAVGYVITGTTWLVTDAHAVRTQGLQPGEPYLEILETLILLSTPAIIVLFATMHTYAPANRKTCSLAALAFAVLLCGITGTIHFVQLTAIRRTTSTVIVEAFALYDAGGRLTPVLATDLVAWDFFFGFGLVFAATIFSGDKLQTAIRIGMVLGGLLCLAGIAGPASGNLKLQYPAIVGYAFIFPVVCLLLAILFARDKRA